MIPVNFREYFLLYESRGDSKSTYVLKGGGGAQKRKKAYMGEGYSSGKVRTFLPFCKADYLGRILNKY